MLHKRHEGFIRTPFLWESAAVFDLQQFKIASEFNKGINITIDKTLRLGKYVERLVSFELSQQKNITVLAENIQIQKDKLTLGELDCLLLEDGRPVHLEIIYKFYLYDPSIGTTEIHHFIGPNRKDSLLQKLTKLKEKQLPLLYSEACKPYLENLNLNAEDITQKVYFKAQLFLPFTNKDINLECLNNDCVSGFYIKETELNQFKDCKFYLPSKKDWLVIPHFNIKWVNFKEFSEITEGYSKQNYSSLFWLKQKSGVIHKVFLIWW